MMNINLTNSKCLNLAYSRKISFNGYNEISRGISSENKQDYLLHETYFFRNIETLEFVKDHLLKNFKNGTHIANFGCSIGAEPYSLMALLYKNNKDKKYKITGFDLSPKEIELAKTGPFTIEHKAYEGLINNDFEYENSDRKYLKKVFYDCFDKLPDKFINYNFSNQDKELIKKGIAKETDSKKLTRLKMIQNLSCLKSYQKKYAHIPKPEFVKDSIDFKVGDVNKLGEIIKPDSKTGVIIFKNAWYHITGSRDAYRGYYPMDKINLEKAEKIIKSASKVLPKKGLLVVGELRHDHLYDNQPTRLIMQNGKRISVFDYSPFHDVLRENGFKPVFYEQSKDVDGYASGAYMPSVWQKI